MKKILMMVVCGLLLQTAQAQLLRFGVKAGIGSSAIRADDVLLAVEDRSYDDLLLKAEGATFGIHFGLMSRINIPLLPIHIQPELLFTSAGGKYTVENVTTGLQEDDIKQTYNRVDIPILVGYKLGPARLVLGPVASFILSEGFSTDSFDTLESDYNSATWGLQAGLGVDVLNRLTIDLRYAGSLSKLGDSATFGGETFNFDSRTSQVLLSVGYFFGGGN